ncbi:fluoride export protein 1 [Eucalyptus grandis]|uniref:fluoride export protein 1 n=1 Tax=Eucalyptus grandis TaxID=71139 RepID=UPI00192F082A|nr:fluoride export protein 1 [Eucalyptus grandis]XP_039171861.1 fluoride export protein 1 [Eucalyptus grandis]XP_039171862.1 fluoride export protein 1 [Eucalyptus grandis]
MALLLGGMELQNDDREARRSMSHGRTSSTGSSLRRRSLNLSSVLPNQLDDDIDSERVSEAGDIGDRALSSKRYSESGSMRLSADHAIENGIVFPTQEDTLLHPIGFWSRDPSTLNSVSPVSLVVEEIISPLSTDGILRPVDEKKDEERVLPRSLEYISCLVHLAVFGILGVLTRYLLQKLFGPAVAGVTSDTTILYLDLPSNMVGSFLMGWFGVVFKQDISEVSDFLAIGLSTGYLGSVTTFSGWNQKMLDLSVHGKWLFSVLGFLIGLFLAAYSIEFGVETAKGFRWLMEKRPANSSNGISAKSWTLNSRERHLSIILVMALLLGSLWALSATMLKHEFGNGGSEAQLWLGCAVGPVGVWIRWFLARLNGRGLGKSGLLKWVPFGTLIANVSAACVMAALSTTKKAVSTKTCDTVATGIQFGLLGCLSTVSTFMAEFNAMRRSKHPWQAYAYAIATIAISFGSGILIYNLPVWIKGYE